MLWRFVPTEGLTRPRSKVFISDAGLTRSDLNEGPDHFAVFLVGNADNGGQLDVWVCRQALLDLEGVDIFTAYASQLRNAKEEAKRRGERLTSDNNILEATGDTAVTVLIEGGLVAGLEPGDAVRIGDKCLGGLLRVVPVALGELVAGDAELSPLADRHDVPVGIDNLSPSMRQYLADGGQTGVDTIRSESIEACRRCLGKT